MGISSALEEQKTARMAVSYDCAACFAPWSREAAGWLRTHLEREASQLASQVARGSSPFNGRTGLARKPPNPGGHGNKRRMGGRRHPFGRGSRDQRLMELVVPALTTTLAHASEDGDLGPKFFQDPNGDFHRWPPRSVLSRFVGPLRCPAAQVLITSEDIVSKMQKHYLLDKASYGSPTRNVINIESILWCYQRSGRPPST